MPLTITIPARDFYDPVSGRFVTTKKTTIKLEYSLLSISNWESKWHKPYLTKEPKTPEESVDFIRCMCLTKDVDPMIFTAIDEKGAKEIADYISNPMTATTFHDKDKKPSREIITSEIVYYWMTEYGIPFDPCEKWHFNKLTALIHVAALKNAPSKKMSKKDAANWRAGLNAQRRAKHHTKG